MPQLGEAPDGRVVFQGIESLDALMKVEVERKPDGSVSDFGLVIRAPNPNDGQRLILIAAGRHSVGTHTACVAITHQKSIQLLEEKLKGAGVRLADIQQPFWAVVRGTLLKDGAMKEAIEVVAAGGYTGTISPPQGF